MEILGGAYKKLIVENTRTGETIAVITDSAIKTANQDVVVRLTPDEREKISDSACNSGGGVVQ